MIEDILIIIITWGGIMIGDFLKVKNKKVFSNNRDANLQLQKVIKVEKNLEQLLGQRNDEVSKLIAILSNIK